jgi:hypothetical protein
LIVTIFLIPETKRKSLEELSEQPVTPVERAGLKSGIRRKFAIDAH